MGNVGKLLKFDIAFELKKFRCKKMISRMQYESILHLIHEMDDISSLVTIRFNLNNILETAIAMNDIRVFNNVCEFADFLGFEQLYEFIQVYYILSSMKMNYVYTDMTKYAMATSMMNAIGKLIYDISSDNVSYDIKPFNDLVKSLREYDKDDAYLRHFRSLNLIML